MSCKNCTDPVQIWSLSCAHLSCTQVVEFLRREVEKNMEAIIMLKKSLEMQKAEMEKVCAKKKRMEFWKLLLPHCKVLELWQECLW